MAEVSAVQDRIAAIGTRVVFVHMGTLEDSAAAARRYGLGREQFVEDPRKRLYQAFGLGRAGIRQFVSPAVWARGARTALMKGFGFGIPRGDPRQMPGVFLVKDGRVYKCFQHQWVSDRPDYLALARMPE